MKSSFQAGQSPGQPRVRKSVAAISIKGCRLIPSVKVGCYICSMIHRKRFIHPALEGIDESSRNGGIKYASVAIRVQIRFELSSDSI
jgi:hypothetical protein